MTDSTVQTLRRPAPSGSPRDYYGEFHKTGPGTLGGIYLRQFWHPIALSTDLAPGRVMPVRVLSEDFTLYRGEDGAPHLTVHRCPHRGTQLSVGSVEGDAIRCHYHGWKFGADGVCIERPAEPNGGGGVKPRSPATGSRAGRTTGTCSMPPGPTAPARSTARSMAQPAPTCISAC
jgi:nitrite reductase/ring-hydroxylating ferredoxin subunit